MKAELYCKWKTPEPIWEKGPSFDLDNGVHVWRIGLDEGFDYAKGYSFLLEREDVFKIGRFYNLADQKRFVISKVFRKILIANYLREPLQNLKFGETEMKKPILLEQMDFHFNISHSGNYVMFVFSSVACGVDVEFINPDFPSKSIMEFCYSQEEQDFVLDSPNPTYSFYRIWTAKESLIKAIGTGLQDNLKEICCLNGVWDLPMSLSRGNSFWTTMSFSDDESHVWSVTFQDRSKKIRFFET
ncbi:MULTISPECIES: 4'-phosphopantetheinyl transferase family protein [Rhodonellum]|nr:MULTISPECIES: 4'-phosphopantetheinyl transferase superfamily protein [Rhodonellum]